jgi:hypothetical protein
LGQLYTTEQASQTKVSTPQSGLMSSLRETWEDKSKTRQETRRGKTYRATAAAGLGTAGDGSAALRACSVSHDCLGRVVDGIIDRKMLFPREWFMGLCFRFRSGLLLVVVICRKGKSERGAAAVEAGKGIGEQRNNLHPSSRPSSSSISPPQCSPLQYRVYPQLVASILLSSSLCKTR